jgi:predicted MPP superfamily phosphohydrolase
MLAVDAAWWIFSTRLAQGVPWKIVTTIFMGAQVAGLLLIIGGRMFRGEWDRLLPKFAVSAIFIWHFIGLAIALIAMVALSVVLIAERKGVERKDPGALSRREFLGMAAALAPPIFTLGLTGVAMMQLDRFRVRRFVLPIPELPRDLDGLTIAHVSDIHVGRFTSGRVLREMVDATNDLRADLVLLTGDLINDALADLSEGLALVKSLDPRHGLWMIEGNHDLIENGAEFERRVRESGVPFLLDESAMLTIRGVDVQILGLRWTRAHTKKRDRFISEHVRELLKQRRQDAFPILLAHHPHAFDAAAEAGVPLTLSGHTHGGQLMLNERLGFGPAMFRYWSGLYTRGGSRLVVSNGVGNWFPIRTHAPAEIVHITLRSGAA